MLCVYSVRDIVADRFLGFQLARNVKEAVRGFIDSMSDVRDGVDNLLVRHPGDFELWLLGWFDEESGLVLEDPDDFYVVPQRIMTGLLAEQMLKQNVSARDFMDFDGFSDLESED